MKDFIKNSIVGFFAFIVIVGMLALLGMLICALPMDIIRLVVDFSIGLLAIGSVSYCLGEYIREIIAERKGRRKN